MIASMRGKHNLRTTLAALIRFSSKNGGLSVEAAQL
jgi:hypothetical protein